MAFRATIGFIVSFLICTAPFAEEIVLNPAHPDRYTVIRGDTLWDIAGRFLRDPWQWPKIWKGNPQIENPDLIYPGDVIALSHVNGSPQLQLLRAGQPGGAVQLKPEVRATPTEKAIPVIPIDAIAQFLSSPTVVDPREIGTSPYVVDFAGEHLLAGAGDRIYVRTIENGDVAAFTVYRPGDVYKDPETGEILGYEAVYVADSELERTGDPATLYISRAAHEVRIGDRLLPNPEEQVNLSFRPHAPESRIDGHIIGVLGGVSQIGQYNVVVIDRGVDDGIETGQVFEILHAGRVVRDKLNPTPNARVRLPDENAGRLMIFRPFRRISYALVMDATRAIHIFDKIATP